MPKSCEKYTLLSSFDILCLLSKVISNADYVLTTTKDLQRYAVEMGARSEKAEMFPLGINFSFFKPMKKSEKLLKELEIFIGTLYTFSGIKSIIKKFHLFNENVKMIIIGGGPDFNNIESLVKLKKFEKHIKLLGFLPQKDIGEYVGLADICINPFEVNYITNRILPTKILEYLACQKPVLSSPLNGTKELIPDEKYGVVYTKEENFVEKLGEMLEDNEKLEELGNRGHTFVKNNFDWEQLSVKICQIFEKIVVKN